MSGIRWFLIMSLAIVLVSIGHSQARQNLQPRLEAVAETQLLMEGLITPNFRGMEKFLRGVPKDADTWKFIRGQSLLIAEAGNLLLMRPPKNKGSNLWIALASDLRDTATKLARLAANRDLVRCRTTLVDMTDICNKCHQSFRVAQPIRIFEAEERKE